MVRIGCGIRRGNVKRYFRYVLAMTGGIDDIDEIVIMLDGGNLGGNSDSAFTFKVTRIHHSVFANLDGAVA